MKYFFGIKKNIFFPLAMVKMKEHKRLEGRNTSEQKNNFLTWWNQEIIAIEIYVRGE